MIFISFLCFLFIEDLNKLINFTPKFIEHPNNQCFELYLVDFLSPFHLVLFLEFCPVFSFGTSLFVFPFGLIYCVFCLFVCFVLIRYISYIATSPGLCRVALCKRCSVVSSGAVPGHFSMCSWGVPCVDCVCPPVVVEP
uniref:Uncharacterized protein n=1 Tax=Myotis myotis TaxID=51298 RepID=A0A7J7ZXY2_MYOMY|nr:hypothetical protein mMyoMyo1_009795 [Myotis myotis]